MDTQGTTIAVIDTDGSGGTTVKVVVGFLIGAVVGIGGTWLIMRDHSNTDEAGSVTATTTPETGGVVTSTTGNAMSTGGTTLAHTADITGVTKHVTKRHKSFDKLCPGHEIVHSLYATTARVEVADNITHELLRNYNFYLHDRLKKYRISLLGGSLCTDRRTDLVRHF